MADLVGRRARVAFDECRRRDDLTRRAEPALHGVSPYEGVDQRMVAKTFDGRHLAVADGVNEGDARKRRHAVELHGACTAMSFATRHLRPGEAEVLAQDLRERPTDRRVEGVRFAVDTQLRQASSPPRCPQDG
jgi:hypothetical protein